MFLIVSHPDGTSQTIELHPAADKGYGHHVVTLQISDRISGDQPAARSTRFYVDVSLPSEGVQGE